MVQWSENSLSQGKFCKTPIWTCSISPQPFDPYMWEVSAILQTRTSFCCNFWSQQTLILAQAWLNRHQIIALQHGLVRDLNPGPLAPEARIIPLDQRASHNSLLLAIIFNCNLIFINAKYSWARPGFEPGTSRTRSGNHTPRPTSQS